MAQPESTLSPFGQQLRMWRRRRGLSQLDLAVLAGSTPRHISFIETGRSRLGHELVERLADRMDVPVRDRNALLTSAGLRPTYAQHTFDDEQLAPFRDAVKALLERHDPYPACAMDSVGSVLMANASCRALNPGIEDQTPEEAIDSWLAPGPGRDMLENWAEVAWAYADRLHREAAATSNPRLTALAGRALAHLDGVERPRAGHEAVMSVGLRIGDQVIRTFATIVRFESAHEVTMSELRVELIFPLDATGDAFFKKLDTMGEAGSAG